MTPAEKAEISEILVALAERLGLPVGPLGAGEPTTGAVVARSLRHMRDAQDSLATAIDHAEFVEERLQG